MRQHRLDEGRGAHSPTRNCLQARAFVSTRLSSSGPGHHHRDDKHKIIRVSCGHPPLHAQRPPPQGDGVSIRGSSPPPVWGNQTKRCGCWTYIDYGINYMVMHSPRLCCTTFSPTTSIAVSHPFVMCLLTGDGRWTKFCQLEAKRRHLHGRTGPLYVYTEAPPPPRTSMLTGNICSTRTPP